MSQITSGNPSIDARLTAVLREGVSFNLFSLPFELKLEFIGEVQCVPVGAKVCFTGRARVGKPFHLEVTLSLTLAADGSYELRFPCPDLRQTLDQAVRGRLPAPSRKVYDVMVTPYLGLFAGCTVILSSSGGEDPRLGTIVAGCNFYNESRLDQIPPLQEVCRAFPAAGLDGRTLVLHLGSASAPEFQFMVEGQLVLAAELGTPAVVLESIGLRVDQDSASLTACANLRFTVVVGGERLACVGGLGLDSTGRVLIYGALDAEDGLWEAPFGAKGLAITGLGVQVMASKLPPYLGLGVRGGARIGGEKLDADLALLFDAADPSRSILDLSSRSGIDVPALMRAMVDGRHVPTDLVKVRLEDLRLTISPQGGTIAGKQYAPGFAVAGQLQLWGFEASVDGQFSHAEGGHLYGAMTRVRIPEKSPLIDLHGAGEAGPSVRIDCNAARQGAQIDLGVALAGLYEHSAALELDAERLYVALARDKLGVYSGGSLELRRRRATLACEAGFHAAVRVHYGRIGLNLNLDVTAAIAIEGDPGSLAQTVEFAFDACGQRLHLRQRTQVRFTDVESLVQHFLRDQDEVARLIGEHLRLAGLAAIEWLRGYLPEARDVAVVLHDVGATCEAAMAGLKAAFGLGADACASTLRAASYTSKQIAGALKQVYALGEQAIGELLARIGVSAGEIAGVMRGVFDWSAKKTAKFLDDSLGLGDKAAKKALEAAGYSANQIKGAMESAYGWAEDRWNEFVDLL